jgi:hypothetical protein
MLNGLDVNSAYPSVNFLGKAFSDIMQSGKSTLGYDTNTLYPGFPPKMSDGRALVASWQPEAVINHNLVKTVGVESNWQYRKYLTKNANEIMKYNTNEAYNDVGYYKRFTEMPLFSDNVKQKSKMKSISDVSDLKQLYLTREQLDSRKISPSINQDDLLRSVHTKK